MRLAAGFSFASLCISVFTYPLPRKNVQPKERPHQAPRLKRNGSRVRGVPLVHFCDHNCDLLMGYKGLQASEYATPLRVARSKTLFSEETCVEKQLDNNGTKDLGEPIIWSKTVNDVLQKLWDLRMHKTVGSWHGAAVHPRGQGGEGEEDVHEFLGANIFTVDNA